MKTQRRTATAVVLTAITAAVCSAQSVTSAHSGTLHYFDGAVSIDGTPAVAKVGKFSEIKENSILKTDQGRAEVLLTPGVFLRVGENTEIKMLDNRLLSTRIELLSGSAIIESDDPEVSIKDPAVTLLYKDFQIQPVKYGVFEINSVAGQLKVFKGQASIASGVTHMMVKEGHLVSLTPALTSEKFNEKDVDELFVWTRDRSAYISAANMSSARTLAANGYSMNNLYSGSMYPGLGFNSGFQGGWYLNPYMNMYTYMPFGGVGFNPFGYGFYSPLTIYSYYNPYNFYWNGGGGSRTGSSIGTTLTPGASIGSQIARVNSLHPTLASPVRSAAFDGSPIAARGGNPVNQGFRSDNNSSPVDSGAFSSRGGIGSSVAAAPVSAGRASGGGGGAVSAGRGR